MSAIALLPLAAAMIYVVAALALKRATELGAGLWHTTFVSNIFTAVAFQGLLVFGGEWRPLAYWWQPLLVAALFLSGQIFTVYSLQRGDVSIATPVLGVKILLVALFATVFGAQELSWKLWLAAALCTAGIASLSHPGAHKPGARARTTVISAGLAAASYALFDVMVQKWSPAWGIGRFLPVTIGFVGVLSLGMIPFFPAPLKSLNAPSRRWLGLGAGTLTLQSLIFVSTIAHFGKATAYNVLYSSRGLWSIAAVSVLGHWFHSREQHLTPAVLRWRWAGAILMFLAITLVLI
jgi:drug/metabolite transporter (DMT)-like permease